MAFPSAVAAVLRPPAYNGIRGELESSELNLWSNGFPRFSIASAPERSALAFCRINAALRATVPEVSFPRFPWA